MLYLRVTHEREGRMIRHYIWMVVYAVILIFFVRVYQANAASDRTLTFVWTPQTVQDSRVTELRVYQDSSDNMVGQTVHPDKGTLTIDTAIDGCSNFWATYAGETEESERTDPPIVVCEEGLPDPEPVVRMVGPGGFTITLEITPTD